MGPPQRPRLVSFGVAPRRASVKDSELSPVICVVVFADELAGLLQLEPEGGHSVTASPEMLSGEVSTVAAEPGYGDSALLLEKEPWSARVETEGLALVLARTPISLKRPQTATSIQKEGRLMPILPIPITQEKPVPAPTAGLGSNSNYILDSSCNSITGLSVTINVTQDIVCQSASGTTKGFSFQLNAYSPKNETSAWQQYVIALFGSELNGAVDNWPLTGANIINDVFALVSMSDSRVPAGCELQILLQNDTQGNITGATYVANQVGITPARGSALDGYWGSDASQHVNFIGTDGHVHELYIHPGAGWVNNDVTVMSGNGVAPTPGSALDGYWGSDSSQHLNFIGTDGHVHELYIHPGAGWVNSDLTLLAGNGVAPARGSTLYGYWGSDSSQHVNFIGTDGHVHELYIHPGAAWTNNDLTVISGNGVAPAAGSALHAYWGSDNSQHVIFIGTDGHVHELYIHPGAGWVNNDVTLMSGDGVAPIVGSTLTGYWGSDSSQHVNFIGTDGHVHELYIHPGAGWVNNDLTLMSGNGVAPMRGSALDAYWGTDSSQHVNFIGTDGHVHELYIHPGAVWANNDVTVMSGNGVAPAPGSALDGYWGSDSSQHLNFIGTDGHLHELYIHPGAGWVNNDISTVPLANVALTLTSISGVTSADLAPIIAFELNLVGPVNGESAVLSSGAGTITYAASSLLTVLNAEPSCAESGYVTAETANTTYGTLSSVSSHVFTQTFDVTVNKPPIVKLGKIRPGLIKQVDLHR